MRQSASTIGLGRRALGLLAGHRRTLVLLAVLSAGWAGLSTAEPAILKVIFDRLSGGAAVAAGAIVAGLLAYLVAETARDVVNAWLRVRATDLRLAVEYNVRARVVEKLSRLPLGYHETHPVGGLTSRINAAVQRLGEALADVGYDVFPTALFLVASVGAMALLDWRLTAVVLVLVPIPALVATLAGREQTAREAELLDRWTALHGRFTEVLDGIVTVKGFDREQAEARRFLAGVEAANRIARRGARRDARTEVLTEVPATLAKVAVLGLGGWAVLRSGLGVGTLVAFLGYIAALFGPVQSLTTMYQTVRRAAASLQALFEILDEEEEPALDGARARDVATVAGRVTFQQVRFEYRRGVAVLDGITLDVPAGQTVALVGPSGSGKTTLTRLLQRFHLPTAGAVRLDGVDLREMRTAALRRHVAAVSQEVHLFHDTVRANIAYGRPDATPDEIEAAARVADADGFIRALPAGYDTVIGPRGLGLSGGQRQRIAIARAVLRDPRVLILDEATSALDGQAEAAVQEALATLRRGRTTFVIAHRLATVVAADRIVYLERGRIVADGTHEELLARCPAYAALVARQVDGLIGSGAVTPPAARPGPVGLALAS
jgi:ATP-binding cassette subfamily B protein